MSDHSHVHAPMKKCWWILWVIFLMVMVASAAMYYCEVKGINPTDLFQQK